MSASWTPSLEASQLGSKRSEKKLLAADHKVVVQRTWSDIYLATTAPVRTGRTWGSKKAASSSRKAVPDQTIHSPECHTHAYGREEFLFMRQLMMDAGALGKRSCKNQLKCSQTPSNEVPPSVKRSTTSSTDSACSTIDTLSDTSEEHDVASTSTELTVAAVSAGVQDTLRADAPEFVPQSSGLAEHDHAAFLTSASDVVPDAPVLSTTPLLNASSDIVPEGPVLSTTPLLHVIENECLPVGTFWGEYAWNNGVGSDFFDGSLHCDVEQLVMHSAEDILEAVDRRTLEWRRYCGLAPTLTGAFPERFSY